MLDDGAPPGAPQADAGVLTVGALVFHAGVGAGALAVVSGMGTDFGAQAASDSAALVATTTSVVLAGPRGKATSPSISSRTRAVFTNPPDGDRAPAMIALPFKLLLFVLVDGWSLVIHGLVQSFN